MSNNKQRILIAPSPVERINGKVIKGVINFEEGITDAINEASRYHENSLGFLHDPMILDNFLQACQYHAGRTCRLSNGEFCLGHTCREMCKGGIDFLKRFYSEYVIIQYLQ